MIRRVSGTEDILDLSLHNFIEHTIKQHLASFNFKQIQTPILEYTPLFVRSLGEATDVVSKEMYIFASDDNEKSICLRPEGTASTIRACVENHIERFPWKVFSYGPMFRRERPQKGRLRQFHQWNMEIIGSNNILQDAHLITILDQLFSKEFLLDQYVLKINFLGCVNDRKRHKEALIAFLHEHNQVICATCQQRMIKNTLRVFDCKEARCQDLYKEAPILITHLCKECLEEWNLLQDTLSLLSINFILDHTLVRGLDYYNKTVFEFSSRLLGAQSAFCGGGHYTLGTILGAPKDFPSVGAAIGLERLILLLEQQREKCNLAAPASLHAILPLTAEQDFLALMLAQHLYINGLRSDIIFDKASVSNMMKKVNKLGAQFALIIGEEEQEQSTITVKNMVTGKTTTCKQEEVVSLLKQPLL